MGNFVEIESTVELRHEEVPEKETDGVNSFCEGLFVLLVDGVNNSESSLYSL